MNQVQLARRGKLPGRRSASITSRRGARQVGVGTVTTLATELLRYLAQRFAVRGLQFRVGLTPVADGWETFVFHFQLQAPGTLPSQLSGPLTVRLRNGSQGIPRGRREFGILRCLHRLDYPVPAPICWEEDCAILGGPFLIMEQMVGPTLLERLLYHPWCVLDVAQRMAEMQVRLHRLPATCFPSSARPLLECSLAEMQDSMGRYRLPALASGLDWLRGHRPPAPTSPVIVHLDFHPLNLIQRDDERLAVLDWDTADVGDPHADLGTTLLLLHCAPNEGKNRWERMLIASGRSILSTVYLADCRRQMHVDDVKLAYYEAWALLRRLIRYGKYLRAGPQTIGAKPSLTRHLGRTHVESLGQRFQQLTGVALRLKGCWNSHAS